MKGLRVGTHWKPFSPHLICNSPKYTGVTFIPILSALTKNHPKCKLFLTLHTQRYPEAHLSQQLYPLSPLHEQLMHNPILYSLKADIQYGREPNLNDMKTVFDLLTTSYELRELDLTISHHGCVIGGGQPWAFNFSTLSTPLRLPTLRKLRLINYDLQESSDGGLAWSWISHAHLAAWQLKWQEFADSDLDDDQGPELPSRPPQDGRTNLEAWMQIMDWSQIEYLDIELLQPVMTTLKTNHALISVKELVLRNHWSYHQKELFERRQMDKEILGLIGDELSHPLKRLELWSFKFPMSALGIAFRKGGHFDSLEYLALEYTPDRKPQTYTSTSQRGKLYDLGGLLQQANRLQTLDLTIHRDFFSSISLALDSLKTLREVTIRIPSLTEKEMEKDGINLWEQDKSREEHKLVNTPNVRELFKDLREIGVEKLDVHFMEWATPTGFDADYERTWRWVCGLEEGQNGGPGCGDGVLRKGF